MITRRGRIIKMPAKYLFLTIIGIVLQTVSIADDISNMTIANEEIIECFNIEEMLYGLSIYLTPFIFIIIMMIIFVVINRSISTCHEVQGQQKVECLDTSFTAATQTRQSESMPA